MPPSTMRMWTPSTGAEPNPKSRDVKSKGKRTGKSSQIPPPKKRPLWLRILKWGFIVGLIGAVLSVGTVAFVFWYYSRDKNLPEPSSLSEIKHRQVTWIVDRNDRRIGLLYGEPKVCVRKEGSKKKPAEPVDELDEAVETLRKSECTKNEDCDKQSECKPAEHETRSFVPYEKIPKTIIDALVATEDASYWDHGGVDYWGMFRAFWKNLRSGKAKEGASTITQQVVKNLLLTPEKTFKRKIQEIILARRLEKVLTKEEILTLYLNQVNFGNARYGVQEASRFYFGKDVWQLNVGEASLLAGLPQSPEKLAPNKKKNWPDAKARQVHVLNRLVWMAENEPQSLRGPKLTRADAQVWIDKPIQVVDKPFPELNTAPEWIGLVRHELMASKCGGKPTCAEGETYLDTLGSTIRTTLDPAVQTLAQGSLQKGLREVDKRHGIARVKRSLKDDKAVRAQLAKQEKALPKNGPERGETYEAVVVGVHDDDKELEVDLGGTKAAVPFDDDRYLPHDDEGKAQALSARFKLNDVVEVLGVAQDKQRTPKHAKLKVGFPKGPEGAVVVIDVKTRKVRALVGGYSTRARDLNRATSSKRQPGSSFKPYVFAAGIEAGRNKENVSNVITYTAGSQVIDAPDPHGDDNRWLPKNYEGGKFEGPVLLRYALAKSINTVAIRVFDRLKSDKVFAMLDAVGLDRAKFPTTPALALGAGEVTLLDHTNALTTFAAGGKSAKPVFIDAIDGTNTPPAETKQTVEPEVAYVTVDMMRSVVTSGTGALASKLGIPIAGKTGTSNDAKDVWFVGMTPDYAIGVWIGYDEPKSMGKETGGTTAVPVFVEIAKGMKLPARPFPKPPKVTDVKIDKETGLLAPDGWPKDKTLNEVFITGTQPTETATSEGNDVKGEYKDEPPPQKTDKGE